MKADAICATRAQLDQTIPHIMAAPKDGVAIEMLCLRPGYGERKFVDEINVTRTGGIPGERWSVAPWLKLETGQPHPGIQICILQKRTLDAVWRDREKTVHPGDTFVVDMDLSFENLPTGQVLQVGSARLRVSEVFNNACVKWKARYGKDALDWVNAPENRPYRLRGALCSVERDGRFVTGDRLTKVID